MPEKAIHQVSNTCAGLFHAGQAALERNEPKTAVADFLLALELEPGFVECRAALRQAAQKMVEGHRSFIGDCLRRLASIPTLSRAWFLARFKPLQAILLAERALTKDPFNLAAHRVLADAAFAAHLPRTAVLSLEALPSTHRGIQLKLARALADSGSASAAAAIYGRLLKDDPSDRAVLRALNSPSIHAFVPAPLPAETPPPAAVVSGPAKLTDDEIIQRYEALVLHCPRNTKVLETLAAAWRRKKMFDKSLIYYRRALKLAGGGNPAIRKEIAQTQLEQIDAALNKLDVRAPDYEAKREQLRNRRLECEWNSMNCPA